MCCIWSFTLKTKCGPLRSFVLFSNERSVAFWDPLFCSQTSFTSFWMVLFAMVRQTLSVIDKVYSTTWISFLTQLRRRRCKTVTMAATLIGIDLIVNQRTGVRNQRGRLWIPLSGIQDWISGPGNHFEENTKDISQWEPHKHNVCLSFLLRYPSLQVRLRQLFDDFRRLQDLPIATGPKDRTTPDRSDRAERSARMRKALEKTAGAAGAWSGPRLEKFVRQTPGTMELRQVGVFRFRIGRWRFVKGGYLNRAFRRQVLLTQESREACSLRPHHAADGSNSWTLRLCMDDLNPPLNDEGMQVFCRWLHQTFQLMREQHSIRSMQMVPCLKVNVIIKAQNYALCYRYLIFRWCM